MDISVPGTLLFTKLWGSRSHNTALPSSDYDYLGVYLAPTEKLLGLEKPPATLTGKDPDYTIHEVGQFCSLLLKGNPNILECLWTTKFFVSGLPQWEELVSNRGRFLSKQALKQYTGYLKDQYHRLVSHQSLHTSGGLYGEKWAYHAVRLAYNAERILDGGGPLVWLQGEGKDERDHLMRVRTGEESQAEVERFLESTLAIFERRLPTCALPSVGDAKWLNQWLVELRLLAVGKVPDEAFSPF